MFTSAVGELDVARHREVAGRAVQLESPTVLGDADERARVGQRVGGADARVGRRTEADDVNGNADRLQLRQDDVLQVAAGVVLAAVEVVVDEDDRGVPAPGVRVVDPGAVLEVVVLGLGEVREDVLEEVLDRRLGSVAVRQDRVVLDHVEARLHRTEQVRVAAVRRICRPPRLPCSPDCPGPPSRSSRCPDCRSRCMPGGAGPA